jgi:hypothetical protein
VLSDQEVTAFLHDRFVCVKINAQRLNETAAGKTRLKAWKISSIPQVALVLADWSIFKHLSRTSNPQEFVQQLRAGERRSTNEVRANLPTRITTRVRGWTAKLRTVMDDRFGAEVESAKSVPLESRDDVWKSPTASVRQVQYGSNGGSGAYRIVMLNGGGYGVNGGRYRVGYGANGGSANFSGYYTQPTYHQPRTYYQPAGFGGYYRGGRTLVCGPWGCALR